MKVVRAPKRASRGHGDPSTSITRLWPVDYLIIVGAAFVGPLTQMAGNFWQLVHPERALVVSCVLAGLACAVAYAISTRRGGRMAAVFPVVVAVLVLTKAGRLLWELTPVLGWVVAIAAVAIAWFLSSRLSDDLLRVLAVVAVVALASGALVDWYTASTTMGRSNIIHPSPVEVVMTERPDMYLVIVDGYMGLVGMNDVLGESKSTTLTELEGFDFQVPMSAWSAFSSTELAVPSILNMAVPADPNDLNSRTRRDLHAIISGRNSTVDILRANGYHTTMVESGWAGSSCSVAFDRCVDSFWLDSLMFSISWDSMGSTLVVDRYGHAFTANALHTMESLDALQAEFRDNGRSDFVFAHVMAPHSPYFLDSECEFVRDDSRFELSFAENAIDSRRDQHFVEQSDCVDRFIAEFAGLSADDDVLVFVGDHGVRRHPPPATGTRPEMEAILEAMNVFVAARVDDGCAIGDPLLTPDLLRQVFSCYSQAELTPVAPRMFLRGGYEMSQDEITRLVEVTG